MIDPRMLQRDIDTLLASIRYDWCQLAIRQLNAEQRNLIHKHISFYKKELKALIQRSKT